MNTLLLVCGVTLLLGLADGANKRHFNLQYSVYLDQDKKVLFRWGFNDEIIKFEVTAPTLGWIGIGFSPSGTMKGADIILAWMQSGDATVLDMHALENGPPMLDDRRNLKKVHMSRNGTHTKLLVTRFLDTCDKRHDFTITEGTTRVIYAYGNTIPAGSIPTFADHHGENRGVKSLRLLDRKPREVETHNGDILSHEIRAVPFEIPAKDTYYHCFYHKLPTFAEKHHIVQFEAILTPGNEKNLHHITMYQCDETLITDEMLNATEECYVNDEDDHWRYCTPVVISWAIGMTTTTFPEHAGFPLGVLGAPKIVKMEIHYDNANVEKGIIDNSGLRMFYTKKLRKYDAGVLLTGHDVVPSLFVPPGSKDFVVQGHCTTRCLKKIMQIGKVSTLNVFGVFLHSHTAGHAMVLRHFRNGTELRPLAKDMTYDFDYQETKILQKEAQIEIGDNLVMECVYDTSKRSLPTLGGLGTRDEMCFGFVSYYPRIDDAYCQSAPSISEMVKTLNARSVRRAYYNAMMMNWTDKERDLFNKKQLSNPIWELCRTLKGPIKGLRQPTSVAAVKAKFVEEPGRCKMRKSNATQNKQHDVIKRSHGMAPVEGDLSELFNSESESTDSRGGKPFLLISIGVIAAVAVMTVVGMIFYQTR